MFFKKIAVNVWSAGAPLVAAVNKNEEICWQNKTIESLPVLKMDVRVLYVIFQD